jgi:hypothetical protein
MGDVTLSYTPPIRYARPCSFTSSYDLAASACAARYSQAAYSVTLV